MKNLFAFIIFFLALQAAIAQKHDTITTPSGLKYVKIKEGKGPKPKPGQKVKIYFAGTLPSGVEFDSNVDAAPYKFTIGDPKVIPGWNEGFQLMSAGEKAVFILPPSLGYGKAGYKDDDGKVLVPQNSYMIFRVELISFK
ncbi:MAG TPA: FKBP-type peptidyl-prolyl cis-trans isomerase [Cytophagaceae bacterium]|jgi:peptidylprolyl isomerase|nr:FKBP-type peptidyl-prolyl cis-trans isomerase [Cytophagaceae bacterium]